MIEISTNSDVHLEDEGTAFVLNVGTDITDATEVSISVLKNNETVFDTWTAEVYQDKKVKHIIEAGDFDVLGEYIVQANVTTPEGSWSGNEVSFIVYRKLKAPA